MTDLNQIKLTECERKLALARQQLAIAATALERIMSPKLGTLADEYRGIAEAALAEIGESQAPQLVTEQVATKLRAKKMSAFVPITAADLLWSEALDETRNRKQPGGNTKHGL